MVLWPAPAMKAAGDDRDGDEGAGLGAVNLFDELGGGELGRACDIFGIAGVVLAFGLDVDDLAADHAGGDASEGGRCRSVSSGTGPTPVPTAVATSRKMSMVVMAGRVEAGDGMEGEGLEGVAGEDGDGFAEDLVAGGLAAAQVIVVEGREVVVDEGVGVEHLDGGAELGGGLGMAVVWVGVLLGGEAPGLKAEDGDGGACRRRRRSGAWRGEWSGAAVSGDGSRRSRARSVRSAPERSRSFTERSIDPSMINQRAGLAGAERGGGEG